MERMYFEDIEVGKVIKTEPTKVTKDRIAIFAYLTGDVNPLHINEETAKDGPFGGIVSHGLLTVSVAMGLLYPHNLLSGMVLRKFDEINFFRPVRAGDNIHSEFTVVSKVANFTKMHGKDHGQISCRVIAFNQKGNPVVAMDFKMLAEHKNSPT